MQIVINEVEVSDVSTVRLEKSLTDDEFFDFCLANKRLRIERTAGGEILIMSPTGLKTSHRNLNIGAQLYIWAKQDGRGLAFDSNAEFFLPNGAARSPDASWMSNELYGTLTPEQKRKFPHLCPEFIVELMSPSDRLKTVKAKMTEWIENGAHLGWLIHPDKRHVYVYRPTLPPECLDSPAVLNGEGPVAGFALDLSEIWAEA